MYSASNTYADVAAVEARLTSYSVTWAADRGSVDGVRSATELGWIEAGIEWANNVIDAAIVRLVQSTASRPQNAWLRDRCVDLAAHRVMTIGGVDSTQVLQDDYTRALEWLEAVQAGAMTVPGLDTDITLNSGRRLSGPRFGCNQWRTK